jgi:uncharacterized peroxidase-related enzyme
MRLHEYSRGRTALQGVALWLSRRGGAELDDVAKVCMRRPEFFGLPFLALTHQALRGESAWSVGERELFAAVVSRANQCSFCVGTHAEISRMSLGIVVDDDWRDGRYGDKVTSTAILLESLTRDPTASVGGHLAAVRDAGVEDDALVEALYVAFVFNLINRVADALDFGHRSDRDRIRGAWILRRNGYRLPGILMR